MSEDRTSDSGIELKVYYDATDLNGWSQGNQLGEPGSFPYTRGVYPKMYRDRLWTMRQYAGFGSASTTNQRFKYLLAAGQTGLSCAFDLPTQMGYDSDAEMAAGEVGRVGVAIDSLNDMRELLDGIPLDTASLSMTINSTAAMLLLMVELVAEEQGVDPKALSGTIQNDILKEYIARGTYMLPVAASMRLVTDTFAYSAKQLPKWHPISISGYHMREAGATASQELAFTLANAAAYVESALSAGLDIDEFAPRLSFFWNAHIDFFEEIAKFRVARRMWARLVRERWGGNDDSAKMKFHVQTGGSTLVAQEPINNVVRTTIEALSAVMGGAQSLHTNGFDEAIGLPSEKSARIALRTQQVIAFETGVADEVDPFAGSYYLESLCDELEKLAGEYLDKIDELGGAIAAVEQGFQQREIEEAALATARAIDSKDKVVVGVNAFTEHAEPGAAKAFEVDPQLAANQLSSLASHKVSRDNIAVAAALESVVQCANSTDNLLPPMKNALKAGATIGEISDALRSVFGTYD